jgi:autotransporter-associated beta strand protein
MATITKGAAGLLLTTGGNWVGGAAPGAADVARWASTSGPATGNMTGSLTILGLQIDGALGDQTYTSGTLTLTQTDAFTNGTSNDRAWINNGGILALGSANRNFNIARTGGGFVSIVLINAGSFTGSGTLSINNVSGTTNVMRMSVNGANTGFTGTIVLNDYTGIANWTSTAAILTACNITVSGVGCTFSSTSTPGYTLGAAGKTLTIDNSVTFDTAMAVASNVALGSVTRTLTVNGNTAISGTVTGTAGVTVAGSSAATVLSLTGSSSGLTGAVTVNSGRLSVNGSARMLPSAISVAADSEFSYAVFTDSFNFPVAPSGLGLIGIGGDVPAGTGCTFPLGYLTSFGGTLGVLAFPAASQKHAKARFYELPGALKFIAYGSNTTPLIACDLIYLGSGETKATNIVVDSITSSSPTGLTTGTYSLIQSGGSGALVISGTVTRTNTSGIASARMSLTLGGSNTANNTLSGDISEVGTNSAILGITKADAGRWVLSGANSSHTGIHTVSAGTLSAQSAKALGSATSAGGVTISGTGVLELAGGITLNKSATAFTIHQTSPITSVGDNTVQTAGITLGGTTTFEVTTGNRLAIANSGAITDGASTFGVTKTGDGELALAAFANTYDGAVTVTAGTLAIGSIGALGTGVATVQLTGNLKYTGTGETLSRATLLNGSAPSFEASGSGALTVSNLSTSVSTKTLTLKGSNTGANTITSSLTDNSGVLSLAKEDAGKWVVTTRTYSGTTAVNAGTLRCEATNSATTTGAVTIGASGTVELVTNTLASSGAGNGEVLGTGNVTCNGGIIKTRGGTTQKGQVRYGGNLTFGAGSSLYIGAAA